MNILFVDESYYFKTEIPFFVLGGVVIQDILWREASTKLIDIKQSKNIVGEIKWKWIFNKTDPKNTMSHLSIETRLNDVIKPMMEFIRDKKINIFTTLTHINDLKTHFILNEHIEENSPNFQEKFSRYCYHKNYENIVQRFHYYLQGCYNQKKDHLGIVVCDGRSRTEDAELRNLHHEMIFGACDKKQINYINLIEHLLIAPSHLSVGIQFADIIAGIILGRLRKFKSTDHLFDIIKNCFAKYYDKKTNILKTEGAGIVKLPKESQYWENLKVQG
jgi:hypothetical protein